MGSYKRTRWFAASSCFLGLWIGLAGSEVLADCTPDPATEGDTVTCTGTDTDGFATESDSVTLTVEPDAEVSGKGGDFATILMGSFEQPVDGMTIFNEGIIRPAYFDGPSFSAIPAIHIIGANSSVTNTGLIDTIFPVDPETLGTAGWGILITVPVGETGPTLETVVNSGSIRGVTGIEIVDGDSANSASSTVNLTNSGDIEGTYWGVNIEGASNVTVISDPFSSVEATHFAGISINGHVSTGITGIAKIIQRASSVISSGGDGIYISNAGVADIELQSGSAEAPTLIEAASWGINVQGIGTDVSVGLRPDAHIQSLNEFGGGGILIERAGDVSIFVEEGSSITTGGGSAIRVNDADSLTIINDGVLSSQPYAPTVWLRTRYMSEFNIVNNGTISTEGGWSAFSVCCGDGTTSLENNGVIVATGEYANGITFWDAGEVLNTGTISVTGGGGHGLETFPFDQPPVAVTNQGLIQVLGGGVVLEDIAFRIVDGPDGPEEVQLETGFFTIVQEGVSVSNGTIRNELDGVIEALGEFASAVRMTRSADQSVTLENHGTITGTLGSVARFDERDANGAIVRFDRFVSGAIEGGPGEDIVVNTGTINGGISLGDGDDSFSNSGTVDGFVNLGTGGESNLGGSGSNTFVNEVGGVIAGGRNVVIAPDDSTIVNHGTLGGDVEASGNIVDVLNRNDVLNTGTIQGVGDEFDSIVGISVGDDNTITNSGLITVIGDRAYGIEWRLGVGNTITNSGTIYVESITEADGFARALRLGDGTTVVNTGDIVVRGSDSFSFDNSSSGISTGDDVNIQNDGLIDVFASGGAGGLGLGGDSTVVNNGLISVISLTGTARGIFMHDSNVVNNGAIEVDAGTDGIGIYTQSNFDIINNGTIDARGVTGSIGIKAGGRGPESSTITNTGSIAADTAIETFRLMRGPTGFDLQIFNSGTIAGDIVNDSAVILLTNQSTGVINGQVDFGPTIRRFENRPSETIVHRILLTNEAGGLITSAGDTVIGSDYVIIDNAGTISSTGSGSAIRLGENSEITNEDGGLISAMGGAIIAGDGSTIVNAGTIASVYDAEATTLGFLASAVIVGNTNDVHNTGTISVESEAAIPYMSGVLVGAQNTVRNDGTIAVTQSGAPPAGGWAVGINTFGGNNVFENDGLIDVSGTSSSVGIFSALGDEVINRGDISVVAGDGIAIGILGHVDEHNIVNDGTISVSSDAYSTAIFTIGAVSVVNNGTIAATADTEGGSGIVVQGGSADLVSIVNTGNITAETAIESLTGTLSWVATNVALENTGTIIGDILFEGGDNVVEFGAGSDVTGDLVGGEGTDTLTLSGSGTFAGAFNGFEELIVTGGTSVFGSTDGSAVPLTTIDGGQLNLNGILASDTTVNSLGRLGGSGILIGDVTNDGTVSPGNSIGFFGIDGDYTQTADGVLSVEIGAGSADLLAVSGTASLDGVIETSFVLDDLAALEGESITVLTAGDVDGQFTNEGTTQQAFWEVTVTSGPSDVQVTISNVDIPLGATSPSVSALGSALSSFLGGSELASAQIEALSSSSVQSQQITGQASANLATATIGNVASFNDAILNRLQDARFSEAAPAVRARSVTSARASAPSWVGWVGYSFVSQFDREALERGARNNVLKFSGGADLALSPRARVGYALGLHSSDLDASRFAGDNQIDGVQASLYGAYRQGKAFVNGLFGVANNRFELERDIDFGFVKESLSGEADGTDVNAVVEAGYDVSFRGIRVIPFASLQAVSSHRESYTESGGVFALEVAGDTAYSLQSALGVKLGGNWTTDSGLKMSSRLKLAWAHEYLDRRRDVAVAFARLPDRDFSLIGRGINHDALEIESAFGLRLSGQLNAVVKYRGLIGSRDTAHGVTLGFNIAL